MNDFLTLKGGEVDVGGAPEVISVLPFGHVVSQKGEFDVDEESLAAMKEQIAQRGVDLAPDTHGRTSPRRRVGQGTVCRRRAHQGPGRVDNSREAVP